MTNHMELVYFWTTSTNPSTINEPQGFNLGSEYDFFVKCDGDKYSIVENKYWESHPSVFKKGCVTNVSVLVGENGAGKSTLLTSILRIAEELHDEQGNGLKDYGSTPFPNTEYKDLGKPHMYIFVFKAGDKIHIFTSLPELDKTGIEHLQCELHEIGGRKRAELYKSNDYPLSETTVLYFTNSLYASGYRDVSHYEGLHSLTLTPKTIDRVAKRYFQDLCDVEETYTYKKQEDGYFTWNWLIYSYRKENETRDFQALVDLAYYYSLIRSNRVEGFKGKRPVAFCLYLQDIVHIIKKYVSEVYDPSEMEYANIELLLLCMTEALNGWSVFLPKRDLFERVLYFNLVFEAALRSNEHRRTGIGIRAFYDKNSIDDIYMALKYGCQKFSDGHFTVDLEDSEKQYGNWDIVYNDVNEESIEFPKSYNYCFWPFPDGVDDLSKIDSWIREVHKDSLVDAEYFNDSINEVTTLIAITEEVRKNYITQWDEMIRIGDDEKEYNRNSISRTPFENITDMNFNISFRYDGLNTLDSVIPDEIRLQREAYENVVSYVAECSKKKHSFVLKFLGFRMLGMSAGERSLQSFYSWLGEIPMLVEKMESNVVMARRKQQAQDYMLKDNIILLLDEPDLYMHPQWQKNLINDLIDELNCQYKNAFIQVIMTTSSPITLSDVPVENTVYIRYDRGNDKRTILPHTDGCEKQTFGADIYKLYANSFFLSGGPMGAYAENYINHEILMPLKEMRDEIKGYELMIAKGKTEMILLNSGDILSRLNDLKWKISMLGCTPLCRKALEMYMDIEEWCKDDTDRL